MATSPNNTNYSVHIDAALSDFSVAYRPKGGVADQLFPVVRVKHESDDYWKWDKGQRFRTLRSDGKGSLRADGTEAKLMEFGAAPASYKTVETALATRVTWRERENADDSLQLEQSRIAGVQDILLIDYELRVANLVQSTANYAATHYTTLSGTSQWNNASFQSIGANGAGGHSAIANEIFTAKNVVAQDTGGLMPNTIVIPFNVAQVMANDQGLIDLIKYTRSDLLVEGLLPPVLWGMKVLVPTMSYQTTTEGAADSIGYIWGKSVWMGYIDPAPGLNTLTFGVTFRSADFSVRTWQDQVKKADYYEVAVNQVEELISADCGYLIQNAIA